MERDPDHDRRIDACLHAAKRVHVLAAERARAHDHRDAEALEAASKALVALALVHDLDPHLILQFKGKAACHVWYDTIAEANSRATLLRIADGKPA